MISSSSTGAEVFKEGTGTVTFNATNTYVGDTFVNAGKMVINGDQPQGRVVLNDGILSGLTKITGAIGLGNVEANGGQLIPGGTNGGALGVKNMTLYVHSTFAPLVAFKDGAALYGRVNVEGVVTLNSPTLDIDDLSAPLVGSRLTLIANDGTDAVQGTFAGLAEGATVNIDGVAFTLSYAGGDGNDVVLSRGDALEVTILSGGRSATFTDVDGDLVTVTVTKGELTQDSFVLQPAGSFGGAQLQALYLDDSFQGSNVTISAKRRDANSDGILDGDGFVNVGMIDAFEVDLKNVTVRGDLGKIDAGDTVYGTAGIASLSVHSLGRFDESTQGATPSLASFINGSLGKLSVQTDVFGSEIYVEAPDENAPLAKIGSVTIGRGFYGGSTVAAGTIYASGSIGAVKIGGDLFGGSGKDSASIYGASIASVTIGGHLLGGRGEGSGSIRADGDIGAIKIGGDLYGQAGEAGGQITAEGKIASISIGGILRGGSGAASGLIQVQKDVGSITVGKEVRGGTGENSGQIYVIGNLKTLSIGGGIIGGGGDSSGSVFVDGILGSALVEGDLRGGGGDSTGVLQTDVRLDKLTVRGSLIGSGGEFTGSVYSEGAIGAVTIVGSVLGGSGEASGQLVAETDLKSVSIGGSLTGGSGLSSGFVAALNGKLGPVKIGVDVQGGAGRDSGHIYGDAELTSVAVQGSVIGSSGVNSGRIESAQKIGSIAVRGDVRGGTGEDSGQISGGSLGKVAIQGSLTGWEGLRSGSIRSGGAIDSVKVGFEISGGYSSQAEAIRAAGVIGSVEAGQIFGGFVAKSGAILSDKSIGSLTVKGDVNGDNYQVVIAAPGDAASKNLAIGKVNIAGNALRVDFLGGYQGSVGVNGDARIGDIKIGGDLLASNIVAGTAAGLDGFYGTADDASIGGTLASQIASITVGGMVRGSRPLVNPNDAFGIIADQIGKIVVGGSAIALNGGANNDPAYSIGGTGDLVIRELAIV